MSYSGVTVNICIGTGYENLMSLVDTETPSGLEGAKESTRVSGFQYDIVFKNQYSLF